MKIVFLGSGNVATRLAIALKKVGHEIVQVYSRTGKNATLLAEKTGAEPINEVARVTDAADLYIFSVKDDALPDIIANMPSVKGVWVHTAGSVSMDLFSSHAKEYGVLYPLQTFSRDREVDFAHIPFFIEGSSMETVQLLGELAGTLSAHVHRLSEEKRATLHLAAVFACNFTNHMYALADEIIGEEGIPFDVLKPLITETAAKVMEMRPREAQTGPAVRFDEKVMQVHLERLNSIAMKELYMQVSKSIHAFAQ